MDMVAVHRIVCTEYGMKVHHSIQCECEYVNRLPDAPFDGNLIHSYVELNTSFSTHS